MSQRKHKTEHWGSQIGVILAVAGSAVGLGNFLRFPGQVVQNGGGAFMIPYLVALVIIAIPLSMSEWALGRYAGQRGFHSQMGVFYQASGHKRVWGLAGGLMTLIPFVINMYYVFIEAWCLLYALQYLGGALEPIGIGFSFFDRMDPGLHLEQASEYSQFFDKMVGKSQNGALFNITQSPLLITTIICVLGNLALVCRGVSRGIELVCKVAAPLILICSILVVLRVVTLGNPTGLPGQSFLDGLGFMWNPTHDVFNEAGEVVGHVSFLDSLLNPNVWLAATAQIFFTISLCWCCITTYASYVRKNDDVVLSSLSATATNEFCEVVLGGLMTIPPAIMFLGAAGAQEGFDSSFALGFSVLANVFGHMPFGQFFGFAFYTLLLMAAITTSVSLIQPAVALAQEAFHWNKRPSVFFVGAINLLGTLFVCWFSRDMVALNVFDFWISCFGTLIFAIIQTFLVSFIWNRASFTKELATGAKIKAPRWLPFVVKFVSFPFLIVVVSVWCCTNLGREAKLICEDKVAFAALVFFSLLGVGLLVLSWIVTSRWKKEETLKSQNNQPVNIADAGSAEPRS